MKKNATKRALVMSLVSLMLCFSMLLGTTYAWFTDSVTSTNNIIKSGNLDVKLQYSTDLVSWNDVDATTNVFGQDDLWEPGYTKVVYLRVSNVGSLAMKYKLGVQIASETPGVNQENDTFYLSEYIRYGVVEDVTVSYGADERAEARGDVTSPAKLNEDYLKEYTLQGKTATATDADTFALVVYMPEEIGNVANHNGSDIPVIHLGLQVLATQLTAEKDSFNDQYDKDAEYPEIMDEWDGTSDTSWYNATDKKFTLSTAEELAGLSVLSANGNTFSGKTIVLDTGVDFKGQQWTPIKQFSGTFDGGEHTVSNFTLDGTSGRAGFIQNLGQYPATVKNLTLSEVKGIAGSNQYFGIVAANGHTSVLENVHVVDCKIETTNKDAWVGGVYGYFNWTSASNCTVENLEIDATDGAKFVGGFSGNMDQDLSINNVDIVGLKITLDATNGACQVGGFTGQTQTGHRQPTFTNCDVIGLDIVAKGDVQLGGFVGDAGAHTIANNCTVEGKVDASGVTGDRSFIGGFLADSGWNNNESSKGGHKLTNCSADVDIITGGSTAGGFIGSTTAYHSDGGNRNMPITMTNCSATGTVTVASGKTATIGGFAGEAERGTFKNCSTTSDSFIGKVWDGYTLNDDGNGTLTVTK